MTVISIHGGPTGEKEPEDNAIRLLEKLLEQAKSGEAVGVAAAVLQFDGSASWYEAGKVGGFTLAGALEGLRHRINEFNSAAIQDD